MERSATIRIRVQPGARRNEVLGFQADVLRLRVTAPPQEGRANRGVVELLAEKLNVAKADVRILRGHRSRDKLVSIEGLDSARVRALLGG
jgi:uncharacterized protein (TIGR00251 family)